MMYNRNTLWLYSALALLLVSCNKLFLDPCEVFSTECVVEWSNASGIIKKGETVTIRATIPYKVVNQEGKAIDISRFQPWSYLLGFAYITNVSPFRENPYDKMTMKILSGKMISETWNTPNPSPQINYAKTDTAFVVVVEIKFAKEGVYYFLTRDKSFHNNSCSAGYRVVPKSLQRNYYLYYEVTKEPYTVHPIEELNPYFFKVVE